MGSTHTLLSSAFLLLVPVARAQTPLFQEFGVANGDAAGFAVAVVGDVDGDGADDFAVGSPNHDAAGFNAGMLRVHSGRTRLPIATWYGIAPNSRFGSAVACAGDVDGDGLEDVVVGASGGKYAEVRSLQAGLLHRVFGGGGFGTSVAGGGLVDGDAIPDFLVGAPNPGFVGNIVVFSGATGMPIRSHTRGANSSIFGWSVTFFGDVDGDGRDEYAAGMPQDGITAQLPRVFAFDGATGNNLWNNAPPAFGISYQLGYSLDALTDVTGDGVMEVVVGAKNDPGVGCACTGEGYVRLVDGATGVTLWEVRGNYGYAGLGYDVAAIGDVDGDGFEDIAAGQPGSETGCNFGFFSAEVQIHDGETGALLLTVPSAGDGFGFALASGDANADGLRDLLVGSPCDLGSGAHSGAVYAYTIVRSPRTYCLAKVNSQGCTPAMFATGIPGYTPGNFRVHANNVINNKVGILLFSRTPAALPFQGAYLCMRPPIKRTGPGSSGGNPPPEDCSGMYSFHFSPGFMAGVGIQPADQIYCQYWSRDIQGVAGTGLTDGMAFFVNP